MDLDYLRISHHGQPLAVRKDNIALIRETNNKDCVEFSLTSDSRGFHYSACKDDEVSGNAYDNLKFVMTSKRLTKWEQAEKMLKSLESARGGTQ